MAASRLDGRQVAVKFAAISASRAFIAARLPDEARILDAVRHPHVVELLGIGALDGIRPFIVMELLAGRTLGSELAIGGPLVLDAAARTMTHVAAALEHIHAVGIVHRDVKPQNIFVCRAGGYAHVKLIDFGVAMESAESDSGHRMAGSPAFMNPEDLLGRTSPNVQSDLWALAVTAYVMLTKRLPFRAYSSAVWCHPMAWHFDPPSSHRRDISERVNEWFQRAFSRMPLERFQSAAEASQEFCAAIAHNDKRQPPTDSLRRRDVGSAPSAERNGL